MKNRVPIIIATTAIILGGACSTVNETTTAIGVQHQNVTIARESMIVQAVDMETAASAVRSVGGEITHRLSIIRGVGALLSRSQVSALEVMDGIKLSENRMVGSSTAGGVVGGDVVDVYRKRVRWQLTNNGDRNVLIERIAIRWDTSAGKLKRIKLKKKEITEINANPPEVEINRGWCGDKDDRKIKSGRSADLKLEFTKNVEAGLLTIEVGFDNGGLVTASFLIGGVGKDEPQAFFPQIVGADLLHDIGITGYGVTVAILDTGVWYTELPLKRNSFGADRIVAGYNSMKDKEGMRHISDESGHGTHITSIAVNSEQGSSGKYNGVAPDSDLVVVKSFDEDGRGTYLDVIRGIDWVVANKDEHNVRVLNCSFSAEPQSHYWDDPINQAVMEAWKAGIVVVASAGNTGPDPMTVGVPGNCPYVITVGAMTDNFTPENFADDLLASFSAAGPTVEGFVKPEFVAPGGHVVGMMAKNTEISSDYPDFRNTNKYFVMSGTSQAAAVTTGATALLLQAEPWLEPDEVKCRLMATAQIAVDAEGYPAYSIFQQGAGLLAVDAAVADDCGSLGDCPTECANVGLDVGVDLDPVLETHFGGPVRMDENGNFIIENDEMGLYLWDGEYIRSGGFLWNNAFLWNNGFLWNNAFLWNNSFLWNNGFLWNNAFLWFNSYSDFDDHEWSRRLTETVSINLWVDQE